MRQPQVPQILTARHNREAQLLDATLQATYHQPFEPIDWQTPTLEAGWDVEGDDQAPQYAIRPEEGMVVMRGTASWPGAGSTSQRPLFTLPEAYRPPDNSYYPGREDVSTQYVYVGADGQVIAIRGVNLVDSWPADLNGIEYLAASYIPPSP